MEIGTYHKISESYNSQIRCLTKIIRILEEKKFNELWELEKECVKEHGAHLDDGRFMFSSCQRCGANLG